MIRTVYPAWDGVRNQYLDRSSEEKAWKLWRQSPGYAAWLKRQWARQGGACFYCKASLVARRHNVEHVIPRKRGGKTSNENLVLACPGCNKAKGNSYTSVKIVREVKDLNKIQPRYR